MTAPILFLLVDAIPWDLAREVWAEGGMPGFREPRPVVSVFPSLTHVAVASLLRGVFDERPPGYEARWYDPTDGRIRGGFSDPESEGPMAHFRARPHGLLGHLGVYFLRGLLAQGQIRWITHRFRREGGPWLGYLAATDGVGHFSGRPGLARAFRDVCAQLRTLREEQARRIGTLPEVVLCSDHGMAFGTLGHLAAKELETRLEAAGFRPGAMGPDGVALVPYGDVGGGVVYAHPERAAQVAEAVASAPGVDVAFGRSPGGALAFGQRGPMTRARLRWRDGLYRYEAETGDPLGYLPVWEALARAGRLADGWVEDEHLFAATWSHAYPDALARVRHGLEDLVEKPAPVLFSMGDDCTYGPALTHAGARLLGGQLGTHGGLSRAQSLGFAACTDAGSDPWPATPALRPEQVLRPWGDRVRAAARPS